MSEVTLTTADGVVLEVPADADTTVLDAAEAAGSILPSLCKQGACGACVATVTAGTYVHGDYNPQAMGPMAGEGAVLLCRTFATSDLSVSLPYDASRIASGAPAVRTATITALDQVNETVVRIRMTLEPDDVHGSAAEFGPGQFMQIEIPGSADPTTGEPLRRAYSLANCGNWDGELEFFIHHAPQFSGKFSTYLNTSAHVGQKVRLHGPQGGFSLVEHGLTPRWFVAGGTGLAPLLSMLRRMAEWGEPQPARLYLGCTKEADRYAAEEIADLMARLPDFAVTTCIWKPTGELPADGVDPVLGGNARLLAGTPADALVADLEGLAETPDIYVCGPPPMVQAVEYALAEAGVDPSCVETERFTQS